MRYGLYVPNFGEFMSARLLAELASEAEVTGWDGFFIFDHVLQGRSLRARMVDPWIALAAIAMATESIRLGTTVTPVARRRPWKLARKTVTLDHLSEGRVTLGVGVGHPPDFSQFGEDPDAKKNAAKLDEGLEILTGLWSGKPFEHHGRYFQIDDTVFLPPPVQSPRIPIWVGGYWPKRAPLRRAARWDGAVLLKRGGQITAKDLREILAFIRDHRESAGPFDLAIPGYTSGDDLEEAKKKVSRFERAGLTWWLESLFRVKNSRESMLARIHAGPPQVD